MSLTLRAVKGSRLTGTEVDNNAKEAGYVGANIASAATVDLNDATGNRVDITGTTTITSFGTAAPIGTIRIVRFQGALTLTHHATNLILPMGVSLVTRAGDIIEVQKEAAAGSNGWRVISLQRGEGAIIAKFVQFPAVYDNGNWTGAATFDYKNGARQKATLTGNVTALTMTTPPGPCGCQLDLYQDGTGSRLLTMPASFLWPAAYGSTDKALSTVASSRDRLILDFDGTSHIVNLMKGIA